MLNGQNVNVRHVEERDLEPLIRNINNAESKRTGFVNLAMFSPGQLRAEYRESGMSSDAREHLLVTSVADQAIGCIIHWSRSPRSDVREIGYLIFDAAERGKGYMSEAATLLTDYLFSNLPVQRLEARINPRNRASARIVAKLGFVKEGTMRQYMLIDGFYADMDLYGLVRGDWAERRSRRD